MTKDKIPAIKVSDLNVYYGTVPALTDINLEVSDGEYLGIIGPNGGGKSTLLKAMLGLVPPTSGSVTIYGEAVGRAKTHIGYVPQFASMDRRFPITAFEAALTGRLSRGLQPLHRYSKTDREAAATSLERVGITDLSGRQLSALSGGEFQRLLIARALTVEPKLLMLDEPTASVDASSREKIYTLLGELNKSMTVVLVTHDLLAVSSQVHRLACLSGKLVYHGEPELDRETINTLYGCPVDLIAHGVPHRVLREHSHDDGDEC
jgi:ABC-type Mn/Zn transport systems, ATPase component